MDMKENPPLPGIPGYISIKQAAKLLGLSIRRVYQFVQEGRLPAVQAGQNILLPVEAVEQFKPKLTGRPRKETPGWRTPGIVLQTTYIQVEVRAGQQDKLMLKLWKIKQEEEHIFPGTVSRYLIKGDGVPATLGIFLVWKDDGVADEAAFKRALEAFEADFADVLDWSTAQRSTGRAIIYT